MIYTPTKINPFENFTIGQRLRVITANRTFDGVVTGFPRNSNRDTDFRMALRAEKGGSVFANWYGEMVISAENDWYGQYHISQVEISPLDEAVA